MIETFSNFEQFKPQEPPADERKPKNFHPNTEEVSKKSQNQKSDGSINVTETTNPVTLRPVLSRPRVATDTTEKADSQQAFSDIVSR